MAEKKYGFKRAASIKVPDEFFNPLITNIREVDESWSEIGGIVPSQVTFCTGQPGAGKTTLCLAIGACVANQVPVAFISLEMSEFQLANQARKIKGFGAIHVTGEFHPEETLKALSELKPGLIILDSIQKAARKLKDPEGKAIPFDRAQYLIVESFTQYAKDNWTPVFLIGHCDKSGNYKGPSDLLHDVDSHLLVNWDRNVDIRTFSFGKNRFGGVVEEFSFGYSRDQVWIGSPFISGAYPGATVERSEEDGEEGSDERKLTSSEKLKLAMGELKVRWKGDLVKIMVKEAVEVLKEKDPELAERGFIKDSRKVKLRFDGKGIAHCHPQSGELVFGEKTFNGLKLGGSGDDEGFTGYRKEQKHIQARCQDKVDLLLWTVVHEWCHLYRGNQHHKNAFFEDVARKYDWLIESL